MPEKARRRRATSSRKGRKKQPLPPKKKKKKKEEEEEQKNVQNAQNAQKYDPSASASASYNAARDGRARAGEHAVQAWVMTAAACALVLGGLLRLLSYSTTHFTAYLDGASSAGGGAAGAVARAVLAVLRWEVVLPGVALGALELGALVLVGGFFYAMHAHAQRELDYYYQATPIFSQEELSAQGLGPPPVGGGGGGGDGATLYLDLMKRSLINLIYCESSRPMYFYGADKRYHLSQGFSLGRRVLGEDMPENAMTMVGLKRLENIEHCVARVLEDEVPGDLIETGSCKGGAVIYMRALLKARGVRDRVVYACDTFARGPPPAAGNGGLVHALLSACIYGLASIPSLAWKRALLRFVMRVNSDFPADENPDDDELHALIFLMKNMFLKSARPGVTKGLDAVKSNVARYGLLDDQIQFLQGWFSETIPHAPISALSVLRLDGDTYPSTMDGLELCFPKLSVGGFVIVDDYYSLASCKRAVDDYRERHGIDEEIVRIDGLSVYWRNEVPWGKRENAR
jgi:hypothetical protein